MTIVDLEAKDRQTAQSLAALGFVETDPCVFELSLSNDLAWLIEYDYVSYTLNEWRENLRQWRKLAEFFNPDFLVATLEAIGAKAS